MLINGSRLIGCPILSLHVGGAIAHVSDVIIDPNDLKIIGFRVSGSLVRGEVGDVLPVDSVDLPGRPVHQCQCRSSGRG